MKNGFGSPLLPERFWDKVSVEPNSGCWLWTGAHNGQGYGRLEYQRKFWYSHRLVYTLLRSPIPDGLVLDHLCCTPMCCNPDHLQPVTQATNMFRAHDILVKGRTHCAQGHAWTRENWGASSGGRYCKECNREKARKYYKANRKQVLAKVAARRARA